MEKVRVDQILKALEGLYPEARAELHFSNPFETLVATILSAQCTDKRVNMVTEKLFQAYPDAHAMAKLEPEELEPWIRTCGLYHNKAKNIVLASRALVEQYGGRVPDTRAELMKLPGVGQKTAGVVLLAAFGDDQIPVDTHVFRVSRRIGLAAGNTPEKVEQEYRPLRKVRDSFRKLVVVGDDVRARRGDDGIVTIGIIDFLLNERSLDL